MSRFLCLFSLSLTLASSAWADCTYPNVPCPPDLSAQSCRALLAAEADGYNQCLANEAKAKEAAPKPTPTPTPTPSPAPTPAPAPDPEPSGSTQGE